LKEVYIVLDVKGKTAVITGGANGIGFAIAEALANRGCNVVITDIRVKDGQEALAKLSKKGVRALFIPQDISKEADWDAMLTEVKQEFSSVDFAFNNAGIMLQPIPANELHMKDWQWIFCTNVWGALYGLRKFTELMEQQDTNGYIVTTASAASLAVSVGWLPYSVSKAAVLRMVEGYQAEADQKGNSKIKYSAVMPAIVHTKIADSEMIRPPEFQVNEIPPQHVPIPDPGTLEGDAMGMISAEVAAERILKQVFYGHTYIFTHRDVSTGIVLEQANHLLLNKTPFEEGAFMGEYYMKKLARRENILAEV
jgi:NAD(P)-dependent dehydrogenase (short-subunit alcohol dehydrogenase family)